MLPDQLPENGRSVDKRRSAESFAGVTVRVGFSFAPRERIPTGSLLARNGHSQRAWFARKAANDSHSVCKIDHTDAGRCNLVNDRTGQNVVRSLVLISIVASHSVDRNDNVKSSQHGRN
jgi:hypothetical protein